MLLTAFLAIVFCVAIMLMMIAVWDGIRSGFSFLQFFLRFEFILSIYKIFDMIYFDYYLLMKYHFFQYYFPEIEKVSRGRKYGFNIKSQLLKLFILFPAASALAAWVCTMFV